MSAMQIIKQVNAAGARFVLNGNELGLDKQIPADLLVKAKQHKSAIRKILLSKHGGVARKKTKNKGAKIWKLLIKAYDNDEINVVTVIDPQRQSDKAFINEQCKRFGADENGVERVLECKKRG